MKTSWLSQDIPKMILKKKAFLALKSVAVDIVVGVKITVSVAFCIILLTSSITHMRPYYST